jgi:hypothetical protein
MSFICHNNVRNQSNKLKVCNKLLTAVNASLFASYMSHKILQYKGYHKIEMSSKIKYIFQ